MSHLSWRELNRAMWDARVPAHLKSPIYGLSEFRSGGLSLRPHEITDLGEVAGRDLVHLQCHFGLDTLSWARMGANVTGLDFSEPAIQAARSLSKDLGLDGQFVTADLYDAPVALGGRTFDIVYTGVGALCWLPDMERWAKVVFELLRPGGELYLYEFHPLKFIFSETEKPEIVDPYFTPAQGIRLGGVTYADANATEAPTVQWNHPLGEIITALVDTGLRLRSLRELDSDVAPLWPLMIRCEDGLFRMPPDRHSLPLMYVLRAVR